MLQKYQGYSFTELLRESQEGNKITHPHRPHLPTQIRSSSDRNFNGGVF